MITLKKLLSVSLLTLCVAFFFTSCEKENIALDKKNDKKEQVDGRTKNLLTSVADEESEDEMDCFSYVYPVELVLPDGTKSTVSNDDELYEAIDNWYIENEDSEEYPTFTYPIDIIFADGRTQSVDSDEEIDDLLFECLEDGDWGEDLEECYTVNYPVEVLFSNGSTQTVNSDEEFDDILFAWLENNIEDESAVAPDYNFPITVTLFDGSEEVIADSDAFEALYKDCYGDDWDCDDYYEEDCFLVLYPVNVVFPDGSTISVNSDEEFYEALGNWYADEDNLESEEAPTYAFPIEVLTIDGDVLSVNSDEELDDLFEACVGDIDDLFEECFEFQYPISISVNGAQKTINNEDELYDAISEELETGVTFEYVYPLSVVTLDGETIEVNSDEDLETLQEDCE